MSLESIQTLEAALRGWGGVYQSEIYEGALHGWMIPGGTVYHPQHAERGFGKLMELLDGTLRAPVHA
jgi:carboxymethylenebutenolidase